MSVVSDELLERFLSYYSSSTSKQQYRSRIKNMY